MSFEPIQMNAARVCDGLRKIGYTPPSAITDIIDNSVQANAKNIYIKTIPRIATDARRDNVASYIIIDDGDGMDEAGIRSALELGSSPDDYGISSLSKFGLGLKSASFSQGEVLEVISSTGTDGFQKFVVSLPEIRSRNIYGAMKETLTEEDEELIEQYLPEGRGTIVRIAEVRQENHPTIRSTYDELRRKLGVIYYYFIIEDMLNLYLINIDGEEEKCEPYDVLFVAEADINGDLDEHDWNGKDTKWIERRKEITLDPKSNVKAGIEVTQLPYPPIFALGPEDRQSEIRDRYMIGSGNYGFYVYRNYRLLSWAESLGVIPQDQNLYSFRGRIFITESADEVFNIDVKKTQFHLSEVAQQAISDAAYEYRRKSRNAWDTANAERKRRTNEDAYGRSNDLAEELAIPDELPGTINSEEDLERVNRRQAEIEKEQIEKAKRLASEAHRGKGTEQDEPTQEEIDEAVTGTDDTTKRDDRILLVNNIRDNALWEPIYYNGKTCVRINQFHRFSSLIFEENRNNNALTIIFNLFLLQLASADFYVQKIARSSEERKVIENVLEDYRRVTSEYLAILCREGSDVLPAD